MFTFAPGRGFLPASGLQSTPPRDNNRQSTPTRDNINRVNFYQG